MELNKINGCIHSNLTINGVSETELSIGDRARVRQKVLDWLSENEDKLSTYDLLDFIVESCGEYSHDEHPCECCGDLVEYYKLEI